MRLNEVSWEKKETQYKALYIEIKKRKMASKKDWEELAQRVEEKSGKRDFTELNRSKYFQEVIALSFYCNTLETACSRWWKATRFPLGFAAYSWCHLFQEFSLMFQDRL